MTLSQLADKIEAGKEVTGMTIADGLGIAAVGNALLCAEARDGSIDAAVKLLEVVPGWAWHLHSVPWLEDDCIASVGDPELSRYFKGSAPTPAAALVAAICRAVEAKEPGDE